MQFRVIWEIDIDAEGPKEAAQEARVVQLTPGMSATVFDVWAHVAGKMHRIDLIEEVNRLDRDELFAVRAGLRLLQSNPDTPHSIQELATIILIFLDRDNMISKRGTSATVEVAKLFKMIRGRQDIKMLKYQPDSDRARGLFLSRICSMGFSRPPHCGDAGTTCENTRTTRSCKKNKASRKGLGTSGGLHDGNCRIDIHRLKCPLPPLRLKKLMIQTAGVEAGSAATLRL
jgi:hypothetical protein